MGLPPETLWGDFGSPFASQRCENSLQEHLQEAVAWRTYFSIGIGAKSERADLEFDMVFIDRNACRRFSEEVAFFIYFLMDFGAQHYTKTLTGDHNKRNQNQIDIFIDFRA